MATIGAGSGVDNDKRLNLSDYFLSCLVRNCSFGFSIAAKLLSVCQPCAKEIVHYEQPRTDLRMLC